MATSLPPVYPYLHLLSLHSGPTIHRAASRPLLCLHYSLVLLYALRLWSYVVLSVVCVSWSVSGFGPLLYALFVYAYDSGGGWMIPVPHCQCMQGLSMCC
ncbi:hypothetical protein OF83DRAFT_1091421 [Amylostereum chailletii]|nr:hypothetical protein OF83DRAFT_1091421 [Amylostereum chailletii]